MEVVSPSMILKNIDQGLNFFYWILFFKVIKMSFIGRNMILEVNEMFFGEIQLKSRFLRSKNLESDFPNTGDISGDYKG